MRFFPPLLARRSYAAHERLPSTVAAPFCQTNYEITEEIKRTRAKRGFLELVDRRITLLPRIDPWQLPISPSFSTLQFGKSFREFEATFSSFLSLALSLSLGRVNGTVRARLVQHDPLITIRSRNYPTRWPAFVHPNVWRDRRMSKSLRLIVEK